jgi:hypothetical protein
MPYCRDCGKEIVEGTWLCPSCQFSSAPSPAPQRDTVIVHHGNDVEEVLGSNYPDSFDYRRYMVCHLSSNL